MRIGVIRVLTTDDPHLLDQHGTVIRATYGVETVSRSIPEQPRGVFSEETFALAAPKVADLAARMEREDGVEAIVLSCAAGPGLAAARDRVTVPVHGAGASAARAALGLGDRVGVLDLTKDTPLAVTEVLGDRLVAAVVPDGVSETRHLLTPEGLSAAVAAAHHLVDRGANVIMFACTGMTTIGLKATLAEQIDVPIVDAVLAAADAAIHDPAITGR
ncbi:hydantoin racemase [Labedella phragmitis]|uniref:Hydantoin racemase n=1 Tax=Labedella phragmitis TaxID=2498849 RepID=A0A444PQD9_9MICO|nr:aspartate/glutamate racemase family protein [Labedella phragmitis]RWZ46598.1 hydantoin racemase [Labedella phragmitis]